MNTRTPILLTALLVGTALAQGAAPLKLDLSMSLVRSVKVDGKVTEQFSPSPKNVQPGDLISQVVNVRNTGGKVLKNVPVTLPVPKNTVYMAPEKDMSVARTEYSIDGGKTFAAAPLKKKVTVTENGKTVTREVEVKPNEYTAVRWTISEISANQTLKLGYRVQVR
ncbi:MULTISPECIES: hypothetical protein [unclassified Deinococcus]|uniref:hypothetical protein n=1 Tax=unclassified Deinococcus TaxID=2623546 RepID=UPI0009923CA9|nr:MULTISPECIES: hypothetical protein [unclassified Deinococcus]MBX8463751.1 hypothetical protein [Deinococcus sp. RIT780]MCD0158341.1 hypothetical protein [Deinococcus sp. 6GRE01]MCD0170693.1 hypothetical protein [Deinococcus sp. 23YEL01]OOV14640.1 hypothetical protein BXU09_08150 [Deinococcus sp. LM3]